MGAPLAVNELRQFSTRNRPGRSASFAAEGKVKAIIETQPLESINNVFQPLKTGKVNGRVVLGIRAGASQHAFKKSA